MLDFPTMNHSNQRNRVFVLGAGFSKPAGMPDARELTQLLLKIALQQNDEDFRVWIEDFGKRIEQFDSDQGRNGLNIEQLFEFAQFDRELWLMKQQECPVGRTAMDTPHSNAEAIATWLGYMEEDLVGMLLHKQAYADRSILGPFVALLRPGDTVLTFNYDTLLEKCITESGMTWAHGFVVESPGDVAILKLHGSLDWWMSHRDRPIPAATLLFQKEDQNFDWANASPQDKKNSDWEYCNVLYRVNDGETKRTLYDAYMGMDRGHPRFPGLGGLGAQKPLHRLIGSRVVWQKAFRALREASEVYVVGWSCSPFDTMARFHFGAMMQKRDAALSRLIVVDPNADRIRSNIETVFGEPQLVKEPFQRVDWSCLIA